MNELLFPKGKRAKAIANFNHGYHDGDIIELSEDHLDCDEFYEFILVDGTLCQTLLDGEFEWMEESNE